jgi:NADH-quinone oxidoreductase subunit M
MLNHGVSTGALFLIVGFLYDRRHSLEISAYGGVATPAPAIATVFMITMLASMGLPMLNGFVSEFLVLQGTALVDFRWAVFAALGSILAACYMLWLYQRVFFGKASAEVSGLKDLLPREYVISIPLIILMVWMGTFPQSFIPSISTSTAVILGPVDAKRDVHVRNALPVKPAAPGASLAKEIADAR